YECQGGSLDLCSRRSHAPAVVDDQSDGDGNVIAMKEGNRLPRAVLVHGKGALLEIADQFAAAVPYRGVQNDQARLGAKRRLLGCDTGEEQIREHARGK